jgi:hypothetical protein
MGTDPISATTRVRNRVCPHFWGFVLLLALAACASTGEEPGYRLVTDPQESARQSSIQLLRHLADGNLEAAARLSNAPQRRLEVLRDYQEAVGEEAFRQVFARYFNPGNRVLAEAAIGERRLVIWDLGEENNRLAGQFFVALNGKFVLDDVPNEERSRLQRVLEDYRKKTRR